ncbi:MAG: tetratricopeptide repeat protein [Pseudomonadota bacterium]
MSPSLRLPHLFFVTLGLGLGLAHAVRAEDDPGLRDQRATRRVLAERAEQAALSEEARALARARRHEAIDMLRGMGTSAEGERKAEMMLRLAELYQDEADDLWLEAYRGWEGPAPDCTEPACNEPPGAAEVRVWREKAERLYALVLQNWPTLPRADEAAWGQAMALLDLDRPDDAQRALTWLARSRPDSAHAAPALVLMGDYHFERDRALPALQAYRRAAGYPDSPIRPYALYKLAWCDYNLGEYAEAIRVMRAVATRGAEDAPGAVSLRDEALRDLARFYADDGDLGEAIEVFTALGRRDLLAESLERVATFAGEQGKTDLAVQALGALLGELPTGREAPAWQARVVRLRHAQGRPEVTAAALQRLLTDYGPEGTWARAQAGDREILDEGRHEVESTLRQVATDWHQLSRKLRTGAQAEEAARLALGAYAAWLARFAGEPREVEIRYAKAELDYAVGHLDDAWAGYAAVVVMDPAGAHAEFCAESAVYVAHRVLQRAAAGEQAPPGVEPLPLSTWDQRLLDSVDAYLAHFSGEAHASAFAYEAAWLLFHRNHLEPAADRFRAVIAMNPGSEEAEQAATRILESLEVAGSWDKLVEVAAGFLGQQGLGRATFHTELQRLYERASFQVVDAHLAQDGDRLAAAQAFRAYQARFPDSEVADLALWNAAVHFRAVGRAAQAAQAAEALIQGYPKGARRVAAIAAAGFDRESTADFVAAAAWYETLAREAPAHEGAADALWSAALFREALGEDAVALQDLARFATAFPADPRQGEALATAAGIHEAHARWGEALATWERVGKLPATQAGEPARAVATLRRGRALAALGRVDEANRAWREVLTRWGAAAEAEPSLRETVAEACFLVGAESLARYEAIDLSGRDAPEGRRAAQAWARERVQAKGAALREVEQAQARVLEAGAGGWGLAALVRLGGAYEAMAVSLRGAWVPPWLTEDQAELYRMGLEDEAWRMEEKGVEAYAHAVVRSRELEVVGAVPAEASRRLAALRPDEHPGLGEDLLAPEFLGQGGSGGGFER